MANPMTSRDFMKIATEGINDAFDEAYSEYHALGGYRLEQCGKLYRVKRMWGYAPEYKSGWLKLKEAQAIMKLLEVSEDGNT